MNLLKFKLRRTAAVLTGAFLGLTGVAFFAAPASAHAPAVSGTSTCATGKGWTVKWSVGNDFFTDATANSIVATDQSGHKLAVKGDLANPAAVFPAHSDQDPARQVTGTTAVSSKDVTRVTLTVILQWPDQYTNDGKGQGNMHHSPPASATVDLSGKCDSTPPTPTPAPTSTTPVLPVPTPPSTDEPGEFTPIVKSDCTTLVIGIDNPANGPTWTLTYETSKGEKRQDVVKPGQKKTETFSAVPGFSVKLTLAVTYKGKTYSDFTTLTYQKPSDCGGAGGGLPVTGAAAGGIAGGAALLLALGGVLFVLARRRKVEFKA